MEKRQDDLHLKSRTSHMVAVLSVVFFILFGLAATPVAFAATVNGNNRNNTLYGTSSSDTIKGNGGNDLIYGYGGRDSLYGGVGDDTIYGGTGNDKIYGWHGVNKLYGNGGNDYMISTYGCGKGESKGIAFSYAGAGYDWIIAHGEDACGLEFHISGGSGNDHIDVDSSPGEIWGGAGYDIITAHLATQHIASTQAAAMTK
jgi:RTX calcium-binding nonapeptide repeat (4 copies)